MFSESRGSKLCVVLYNIGVTQVLVVLWLVVAALGFCRRADCQTTDQDIIDVLWADAVKIDQVIVQPLFHSETSFYFNFQQSGGQTVSFWALRSLPFSTKLSEKQKSEIESLQQTIVRTLQNKDVHGSEIGKLEAQADFAIIRLKEILSSSQQEELLAFVFRRQFLNSGADLLVDEQYKLSGAMRVTVEQRSAITKSLKTLRPIFEKEMKRLEQMYFEAILQHLNDEQSAAVEWLNKERYRSPLSIDRLYRFLSFETENDK